MIIIFVTDLWVIDLFLIIRLVIYCRNLDSIHIRHHNSETLPITLLSKIRQANSTPQFRCKFESRWLTFISGVVQVKIPEVRHYLLRYFLPKSAYCETGFRFSFWKCARSPTTSTNYIQIIQYTYTFYLYIYIWLNKPKSSKWVI